MDDGVIPPQIKECRSILIPKSTDPDQLTSLTNWRPLTISSTIARTFSRILTNRLSAIIPISPRQRGFIKAPGCSENVATLANAMREAKRNRKTPAVVMIDFAKAFDSVSHAHVCAALRAKYIPQNTIKLIASTFVGATTAFDKYGKKKIRLQKGVKQGDPLSPLLFNCALDHLTTELERTGSPYIFRIRGSGDSELKTTLEGGAARENRVKFHCKKKQKASGAGRLEVDVEENMDVEEAGTTYTRPRRPGEEERFDGAGRWARKRWKDNEWTCLAWFACLAFADDLTLVSGCWLGMQNNLDIVKRFCDNTGLDLNLAKTKGFLIKHDRNRSTLYNNCDSWTLHVRYLGANISPMSIFVLKDLPATLNIWLGNIRDAPIRATTRAALIKNHVVPRLLHQLTHCDTPQNQLHEIDLAIRMAIKRALHLPAQTPDGFLYTKSRDGGIGLTCLGQAIPRIRAAKDWALIHSPDGVTRTISLGSSTGASLPYRLNKLGLKTDTAGNISASCWRNKIRKRWYAQQVYGLGAAAFHDDTISNVWLHKLKLGRIRHTLAALQLRSNTYPDPLPRPFCLSGGKAKSYS